MQINTVLLTRGFKWEMVVCRKSLPSDFTIDDYKESVEKAISTLPEDLVIKEIIIESECIGPKHSVAELKTIIYWKE